MRSWCGSVLVLVMVLGVACGRGEAPSHTPLENEVRFTSEDGKTVYADYYPVKEGAKGFVLLFHQAYSNAGEYEPVVRRLNEMGYSALAVDLRSGGERWGRRNRTADGVGGSPSYESAYQDMRSALDYARAQGAQKVWVWGSSYSASLALRLASERGEEIEGLCLFSPGEYFGGGGVVKGWARGVRVPILGICPEGESATVEEILSACGSPMKVLEVKERAVHGASMLREDRNPLGWEECWRAVVAFMEKVSRAKGEKGAEVDKGA